MKEITCNLCQSRVDSVLFDWGSTAVVKCDKCGLVFRKMALELSQEEIFAFQERVGDSSKSPSAKYDASYREDDYRVVMWKNALYKLEKARLSEGKRLLDIGSAKGTFLDVARKRGWEPIGVEPSESSSNYAKQAFGVPVFAGILEEAEFPSCYFDVVTMWDLIEHLKNPSGTIAEVFRILKPGGCLFVHTPNHDSLITCISGWLYRVSLSKFPLERLLYPPVHLYFFTPKTLSQLLHKSGFNIGQVRSGHLHAERCLDSPKIIRFVASVIDFAAKWFNKGYRISVIASKPLSQESNR